MPAPNLLPSTDTLVRLRRKHRREDWHPEGCSTGHSLQAIADMYGVSHAAVWKALRNNAGITAGRPRYTETLPWVVATRHQFTWEATMLRELGKRLAGRPESEHKGIYLDGWLKSLDDAREVIDYDHETGFRRVKRKRGETGYIRKPRSRSTPG